MISIYSRVALKLQTYAGNVGFGMRVDLQASPGIFLAKKIVSVLSMCVSLLRTESSNLRTRCQLASAAAG